MKVSRATGRPGPKKLSEQASEQSAAQGSVPSPVGVPRNIRNNDDAKCGVLFERHAGAPFL